MSVWLLTVKRDWERERERVRLSWRGASRRGSNYTSTMADDIYSVLYDRQGIMLLVSMA